MRRPGDWLRAVLPKAHARLCRDNADRPGGPISFRLFIEPILTAIAACDDDHGPLVACASCTDSCRICLGRPPKRLENAARHLTRAVQALAEKLVETLRQFACGAEAKQFHNPRRHGRVCDAAASG